MTKASRQFKNLDNLAALKQIKAEVKQVISGKISNVPDSTCETCSQRWEGECRAYCMPHSEAERMARSVGRPACSVRSVPLTPNQIVWRHSSHDIEPAKVTVVEVGPIRAVVTDGLNLYKLPLSVLYPTFELARRHRANPNQAVLQRSKVNTWRCQCGAINYFVSTCWNCRKEKDGKV